MASWTGFFVDVRDRDHPAPALDAGIGGQVEPAAGRAAETRPRHVRLLEQRLDAPPPEGANMSLGPSAPRSGSWSWIAFQVSFACCSRSCRSSWRARSRTWAVGVLRVDVPAGDDPVAEVAMQPALELGQDFSHSPPMIKCWNGSRSSSRIPASDTLSKCWWNASRCSLRYTRAHGTGRGIAPGRGSRP